MPSGERSAPANDRDDEVLAQAERAVLKAAIQLVYYPSDESADVIRAAVIHMTEVYGKREARNA